jgi:hypothetical protein
MISTFDQALAGARPPFDLLKVGGTMEAAGVLHSLFYSTGAPGAAAAPSPGLGGAALTTYAGQIPFTNPPALQETRLMRLSGSATQPGKLILCDRLWHNSGIAITTTTGQTVNSVTWPSRCPPASGLDPDALGLGVMVGLEVSTATTNASAITNTTITYTDSAGNSGNTGTVASFPATAVAGTFVPFQFAAGDSGIRSVQTLTLGTSYAAGTVHLVAYRKIAELPMPLANVGYAIDIITSGNPRLYDSSVPFLLWHPNGTAAVTFNGLITVTQG